MFTWHRNSSPATNVRKSPAEAARPRPPEGGRAGRSAVGRMTAPGRPRVGGLEPPVPAIFWLLFVRTKSNRRVRLCNDPIEGSCTIRFCAATRCGRAESWGRVAPGALESNNSPLAPGWRGALSPRHHTPAHPIHPPFEKSVQPVLLTAGNKHLPATKAIQNILLPSGVQLAEDIV